MDEEVNVVCSCRRFSVSRTGRFARLHEPNCPFSDPFDLQPETTLLRRRSFFLRGAVGSKWHNDVLDDPSSLSDVVGDVQFDQNFISSLVRELRRNSRLEFIVGSGSLLSFRQFKPVLKKSFRGGIQFKIHSYFLIESNSRKVKDETKLKDVMASFASVFSDIVDKLHAESEPGDLVQFIVYTEVVPVDRGESGMRNPISTPLIRILDLNKNAIMPFVIDNFKEYDHIEIGNRLVIETVTVRRSSDVVSDDSPSHGSIIREGELGNAKRLEGVIRIYNEDHMCLARAVSVCVAFNRVKKLGEGTPEYNEARKEYEDIRHGQNTNNLHQTRKARELCQNAKVNPNLKTSMKDVQKIANYLQAEIKIVSSQGLQISRKFGDCAWKEKIYLLERKIFPSKDEEIFHFDAIISMRKLKQTKCYCEQCDVSTSIVEAHVCKDRKNVWCFACYSRDCSDPQPVPYAFCNKCSVPLRSEKCRQDHEQLNKCRNFFCFRCKRTIFKKLDPKTKKFESNESVASKHQCLVQCRLCGRDMGKIHRCFMLRQPFMDRNENLLFLDFETDQSSGEHVPIFCAMSWVSFNKITNIKEEEKIETDMWKCFGPDYSVAKNVGDFLFQSKKFQNFTMIAHNMRGFDACFLIRYLHQNNIHFTPTVTGLKLTSTFIPSLSIRLIDSLNFFPMPLSALPKAMGIEHVVSCKGFFPHFFSAPENLSYIGKMPDPEFFGCYDMKSDDIFREWYLKNQNETFNFKTEVEKYCRQDVLILKEACLEFRKQMARTVEKIPPQPDELDDEDEYREKRLKNVDPNVHDPGEGTINENKKSDVFDFENIFDPFSYMTAPGMAHAIFKGRYLKKNSIAQISPSGYEQHRHSQVGLEYVEYLKRTLYPDLVHALCSKQEVMVMGKYYVDGYVPSKNIVVEFHGCFWHGCPECVQDPLKLHPVRQITYQACLDQTLARENDIRVVGGYTVEVMWECRWKKIKKGDAAVRAETDLIFIKSRLSPRDAFRGGRVETGKLIYDIKQSRFGLGLAYVDICSLYPTVNCYDYYPVGHPEIFTSNFDFSLNSYFGLVQCCILPPQNLLFGILPVHCNGKLLFPLCRTCSEKFQTDPCTHSEDERFLFGVWVSEELKVALSLGYKIIDIFCVHHFERKSNQLFSNYIRTFFKLKLTASKRPKGETPEQLNEFIREVWDREKIKLTAEEFQENAGLRSIAKLCLNSFWGRLGMRDSFPKVSIVYSLDDLHSIIDSNETEISSIRYLSENCVAVLSKNKSIDTLNFTNNTNIYLAVFTTAHARMRLLKLLLKVGDRFVYCDTDSVIYEISPNSDENLPTGEFMGDLTSELDEDEIITEFVSGGPKVYAFKTNKDKYSVKIKGFQLNVRNKAAFSFQNLKNIVEHFVRSNTNEETGRVDSTKLKNISSIRDSLCKEHFKISKGESSAIANEYAISNYNAARILRTKKWELFKMAEQKMYVYNFDKRIVKSDFTTIPYGYVE